ncbi:MAG: HAD family hydrolase [Gemmatimonadota bacterium]
MNRKMLTFDCYGTLVDWETGIAGAFQEEAARDGVRLDRERVLAAYARAEAAVEAEAWRPYREVLAEAAMRAARELGWGLSPERATFLARSLPEWRPFPDTHPALERLAGGHALGLLSNVDDDLLDATRRHLGVAWDLVVTAEQVRSYKPRRAHWIEARRRLGDVEWTHVAQSYVHDVQPCLDLGLRVVWVNRGGRRLEPADPRPPHEVADLAGAARLLAERP